MHCLNRTCPAFTYLTRRWLTCRHSCSQLFVGGLSFDTNESILMDAFGELGEIIEVKVICDRVSGKSKGYGFVNYSSEEAASKALKEMDGRKYPYSLCPQRGKARKSGQMKRFVEKLEEKLNFDDCAYDIAWKARSFLRPRSLARPETPYTMATVKAKTRSLNPVG
ncbi:glycine-rich RNA-binding protein 4 mitochondrial [Phtheirospermum japonicum]|uniref:Glycine-rich RNA-binding protein 4 mitochondrial n=1 Tax=Phtheirospermum japonicum TaxID=374723 RepID=A0A830B8V8_9LAMI|nr:glycine-rich RNA-binding protein 4 mitochondrial [Phtheirospermum japonicum]